MTTATYNENWGWWEEKEKSLFDLMDKLNERWVKFALSNVFDHKWKSNDLLKEWSKKYNVNLLKMHYAHCNHHTKNRDKESTQEVLVTNY